MPQTYTLSEAVTEACERFAPADAPSRYFSAALKPANAWRRTEFVPTAESEIKTAFIEVGEDMSLPLPDDYVNWTLLGLQLPGWGTSRNLIYNATLPALPGAGRRKDWLSAEAPDDFLEPPTVEECEACRYGDLSDGYDGYCGFGAPAFGAQFSIDTKERRIILNSRVPAQAMLTLEYYGFRVQDGSDPLLDPMAYDWAVQAILAGLNEMKKDWAAVAKHEANAAKLKAKYETHHRNLSPEGIKQANHQAAAQRWK